MIIKREKEYRQLREAYEAKENRLIILSGRFGVGKTTLVRQFAQENAGYYYQAAGYSRPSAVIHILAFFLRYVTGQKEKR